ncbi:MAG: polysaccharide biosynthesis protein [Microcystis aeruginosa Ma_QC_C_20070703_M131]|uniref:Polysaccharide biosynthesis protein n=1 Tax=Microcystis aeruginosa Ma_QC_C_20070703_M131 TaxID=2486263 RepID=A0A551X3D1_MICAE|nr:MAG: polysaccharide biosynthesis protein [Microcystis aeruginosa Ma_QC_C_20070703_M131]
MSLRAKVMRGGAYLAGRQGLGMVLSIISVFLVTRLIGPENYGLFVSAFGVFSYLQRIFQLGINFYLIREINPEEEPHNYHQGFTLMLLLGILGLILGIITIPLLAQWIKIGNFSALAISLFFSLPFVLCFQIPLAKLERELNYKKVAMIELLNQCLYVLVSVYFAFQGAGAWALVAAWWAQTLQSVVLFFWCSGYRPRLFWNLVLVKDMLGYGITLSAAQWIFFLRDLVNPLLVGRFGGAEAVGFVALAIRLVEVLSFVKHATWRISMAALAKIQDNPPKLRWAITEGMSLQVLALGPILDVVAWTLPLIIGLAFGERWRVALQVYPFIAWAYLTNSLFNLHSSTLYVLRKNTYVALFHLLHVALFAGGAWLLLPKLGIVGYGWAEVIALPAYGLIHLFITKIIGSPDYRLALLWWIACSLALFVQQLGMWTGFGLLLVILLPITRQQIRSYWHSFQHSS